uniref:Uncharacterized protein n=1 Tax=Anguilla anguilla TaxID=7936 RepID=A0A0E9WW00_ANGAN
MKILTSQGPDYAQLTIQSAVYRHHRAAIFEGRLAEIIDNRVTNTMLCGATMSGQSLATNLRYQSKRFALRIHNYFKSVI